MKCPECGSDQKYATSGMICQRCGYTYTLNPKTDAFPDGKMKHLIQRASYGGTKHYTINMLYAAWLRDGCLSVWPQIGITTFVSLVVSVVSYAFLADKRSGDGLGAWFVIFLVLWVSVFGIFRTVRPGYKKADLVEALNQWSGAGKDFGKLLESPSLHQVPQGWSEPDIYDYGAEKILIVDRDILVDLFVLNGYHAESSALVLSATGYPSYIAPHAERLLNEQATIPVLFLHDADCSYAEAKSRAIQAMPFLTKGEQKIDVGIGPKTLRILPGLKQAVTRKLAESAPVDLIPYLALASGINLSAECGESLEAIFADPNKFDYEASITTSFG